MPLGAVDEGVALPAAAAEVHVERGAAFLVGLGVRIGDADIEAGSAFEDGHFREGSAAHPQRYGEAIRLKGGKFDLRFAVEGGGLAGAPGDEGGRAFDGFAIAVVGGGVSQIAFEGVLGEEGVAGRLGEGGEARLGPGGEQRLGFLFGQRSFVIGDGLLQPCHLACLCGCGHFEDGRGIAAAAVEALFGDGVEEGEEAVVVLLRDGVELVIVAAGAAHGEAHEDVGSGVDAVGHIFHLILFGDRAAFVIDHVVAVEAAGEFLLDGGVG